MRSFLVCFLVAALACMEVCGKPKSEYIVNKSNGIGYRLMYQAKPWEQAKQICEQDGAKLAVPKSEEEFSFIQKLVRGMAFHQVDGSEYKLLVWLGISNLDNYTIWKTIDGENIENTGFSRWAGHNGEAFSGSSLEPHCVGVDAKNPGFRDFWCSHHQPYLCQIDA